MALLVPSREKEGKNMNQKIDVKYSVAVSSTNFECERCRQVVSADCEFVIVNGSIHACRECWGLLVNVGTGEISEGLI